MKRQFGSWLVFTRTERIGLIVLLVLLTMLVGLYSALPQFIHPHRDWVREKEIAAQWKEFIAKQPIDSAQQHAQIKSIPKKKPAHWLKANDKGTPIPEKIDLNTVDSVTLLRLRYMGPSRVSKILSYRRTFREFPNIAQFQRECRLKDQELQVLLPHLKILKH